MKASLESGMTVLEECLDFIELEEEMTLVQLCQKLVWAFRKSTSLFSSLLLMAVVHCGRKSSLGIFLYRFAGRESEEAHSDGFYCFWYQK